MQGACIYKHILSYLDELSVTIQLCKKPEQTVHTLVQDQHSLIPFLGEGEGPAERGQDNETVI